MTKLSKVIAWLCVANGVLTLATPIILYLVYGQVPPVAVLAIWSILGVVSLIGGYFALRGNSWGFWLLFVMFLVQVAEYWSPSLLISFVGPVAAKVGWGWNSPPSRFNVNLLAIVGAVLSFVSARGLTMRSTRTLTGTASPPPHGPVNWFR